MTTPLVRRLRFDISKNVGIGTNKPRSTLDVSGSIIATDINITGNFLQNGILFSSGGGGSSQWSNGLDLSIYYNTGNVGIGSATPKATLDVSGNVLVRGNITPSDNETYDLGSSNNRWRDLYLSGNTIDLGGTRIQRNSNGKGIKVIDNIGNTLDSTFKDVLVDGSIGIGTITPLQKLDVSGNAFIRGNISGANISASGDISTSNINFSGNLYQNGVLFTGSGGGGSSQWTTSIGSSIYYNSGNIGIGTITPLQKLDVLGNINYTGNLYKAGLFQTPLSSNFNNSVIGWGENYSSQITIPVAAQSGIVAISAGTAHSLALNTDGSVVGWGYNFFGQVTIPVAAQSGVVAISTGTYHSLALKNNGSVIGWGTNFNGETTTPVAAQSGVITIAAGGEHSLALKNDGSIIGWGNNDYSQSTIPIAAQLGIVAIAGGLYHSLALKNDSSVIGWGQNFIGQTTIPVAAQSGVVAIAAGGEHSLALKTDGSVIGWGSNTYGQSTIPVAAQSGVIAIAAGYNFSMALKTDGSVIAWGRNGAGQATVPVAARSGIIAIAAGYAYSLALKSYKQTYILENIGIGTTVPQAILDVSGNAFIRGDISTSNINFSGNLYQNGVLFTGSGGGGSSQWTTGIGSNIYYNSGNVGIGSSNPIATLDVSGNILCSKVIGDLSGNANTVTNGVYTTGNQAIAGIKTFTSNIGIGTTFPTTGLHVQVYTLFNKGLNVLNPGDTIQTMKVTGNNYGIAEFVDSNSVSALIIGSNRNVGIGLNNPLQKLDVSGNAFIRGNVGIGSSNPSATLDVSGNIFASNIITSGNITPSANQVYDLGSATNKWRDLYLSGQTIYLGNSKLAINSTSDTFEVRDTSTNVLKKLVVNEVQIGDKKLNLDQTTGNLIFNNNVTATKVTGGGNHTAVLLSNRTVHTFGRNNYGQLGDGTITNSSTPVQVLDITTAIAVSCGTYHTAVLLSNGSIRTFGYNSNGQLGNGTTTNSITPVTVLNITTAIAVACGGVHNAVLLSDGTVRTFGYNYNGQLGDGTTTQRNSPVTVSGITTAIAIACGDSHTAVLLSNGTVRTFGQNNYGQLGDSTTTDKNTPVTVLNISTAIAIACGNNHTLVLLSNGTVSSFGWNNFSQLGNGTTTNSSTPVQVLDITTAIAVACGGNHNAVLLSNGTVRTFGWNNNGQLGNNSTTNSSTPITVLNISTAIAIECGGNHTIILLSDETIRTFGYNNYGQLGDGTTTQRNTSVAVLNIPIIDYKSTGSWLTDTSSNLYYNSGNVGIGSSNPNTTLDVSGNAFIRGNISTSNINFSGNLYQNGVLFNGAFMNFNNTQVVKYALRGYVPDVSGNYYVGATISWSNLTTNNAIKAHLSVKCSMAGSDTENAYRRFETIVHCINDVNTLKPRGIMNLEAVNFNTNAFSDLTHEVVRSSSNAIDVKIQWSSTLLSYVTYAMFEIVAPIEIGTLSFSDISGSLPVLSITSIQPTDISGVNTYSAASITSYTFSSSLTATWSITPITYGDINPTSGELTITFPQATDISGTFVVTATRLSKYVTQSWLYNIISEVVALYSFTTNTFTNAGVTGRIGPTLAQIRTAYSAQSWAANTSYLNVTIQGVQDWTVPLSGTYNFIVAGAIGGTATSGNVRSGGLGNVVYGNVVLTQGDIIKIIVGQRGTNSTSQAGGGGGSFVFKTSLQLNNYLFVAGGGGGATNYYSNGSNASSSLNGTNGSAGTSDGAGAGGIGGTSGSAGSGGGGRYTTPVGASGSSTTVDGGIGSTAPTGTGYQGGGGGGGAIASILTTATFIGGNSAPNIDGGASVGAPGAQGGFGGGGSGGMGSGEGGGAGGGGGYSGGGGGGGGGYGGVGGGGGSGVNSSLVTSINTSYGTNNSQGYVTITKL